MPGQQQRNRHGSALSNTIEYGLPISPPQERRWSTHNVRDGKLVYIKFVILFEG